MHVCMNVCISLYTYVGVHACMCVRLAKDFMGVNTEKNSLFVVRKYLLFTGKLDFYSDYKFYRGSCLICLIRSYGTAAESAGYPSQCYNSSKQNMYDPWNLGG